jgi:hypothetical protein
VDAKRRGEHQKFGREEKEEEIDKIEVGEAVLICLCWEKSRFWSWEIA